MIVFSIPRTLSVLFFAAVTAALLYKEARIGNRTATLVINVAVFAASVLCFMVLIAAYFTPLISDITSLNR
jgi:hypothetical protein